MSPLVLAFLLAGVQAEKPAPTPAERQRYIDSFEHVWKTVRDKHWDPTLNGLDWQAIHDELQPQVEKAVGIGEVRGVLQEMLGRLKQSHFAIIPAETYSQFQPGPGSRDGAPGLDVRLIDGRVLVTTVEKDSPAERAGIRPGWEIAAIEGKEVAPMVDRLKKSFEKSGYFDIVVSAGIQNRLRGEPASTVKLDVRNGSGKTVEAAVERVRPRGVRVQLGFLPPMYVWSEARRVEDGAGYIAFNMFMDPENVMRTAGDAITSCIECRGLVIDLRGNPGGIAGMAMGLAGWFVKEKGLHLGTMFTRETKLNFVVNPRPAVFGGRLAILVDGCSGSTAEIFAGGMKDIGRARIFGTRTLGGALPSVIEKLPTGDGFQYAFANYISAGGKPLEGDGVSPHVEVKHTREALLEGRDLALEAALKWIKSQE